MAVRFDAATEEYTRTLSLGVVTQFAIACWLKVSVDRNAISTAWCVDNGFAGDYIRLCSNTGGTTMQIADDVGNHTLASAGVGTWQYVGFSMNGADVTAVMQAATAASPSVFTWASGAPSQDLVNLRIGDGVFDGQFLNGCVAAFKIWTGVTLSEDELAAEAWRYLPQRTDGLAAWYPFLRAETTDYSGRNRTLSGGTGSSTEDGPPIRWSAGRRRIVVAAGATLKSLADAGAAADALMATAVVALADSGSAADGLSVEVPVALADAGTAVEALSSSATVSLADAGSGADLLSTGTPKSVADTASATDAISTSAAVPLTETASAADTLSASVTVALADSGEASDAMTSGELVAKSLADSGVASDALSVQIVRQIVGAGSPYTAWSAGVPEVRWVAGAPYSPWAATGPSIDWAAGLPWTRYSAGPPVLEEV